MSPTTPPLAGPPGAVAATSHLIELRARHTGPVILVDKPIWPAHGKRFAHLISDASFDELHAFAADLGLPAQAFHRDHYDLPDDWWDDAVAMGATPVDPRELVRRLKASGLRAPRRGDRPSSPATEGD